MTLIKELIIKAISLQKGKVDVDYIIDYIDYKNHVRYSKEEILSLIDELRKEDKI